MKNKLHIEESLHFKIEPVTMTCRHCDGHGYTSEHNPDCYGPCENFGCPIQVQCEDCHGEGHYITMDWFRKYISALETALTEKHRAEVDKLKNYAQHKAWCDGANVSFCGEPCTCGLDQLLTTK